MLKENKTNKYLYEYKLSCQGNFFLINMSSPLVCYFATCCCKLTYATKWIQTQLIHSDN